MALRHVRVFGTYGLRHNAIARCSQGMALPHTRDFGAYGLRTSSTAQQADVRRARLWRNALPNGRAS
jgi:hypothetical protein